MRNNEKVSKEHVEAVLYGGFSHVLYEMEMFLYTIASLQKPKCNQFVQNLYSESYILHLRNLIEFFQPHNEQTKYGTNENNSDLILWTYYIDERKSNLRQEDFYINGVEREDKDVFSTTVQHLTYKRFSLDDIDGVNIKKDRDKVIQKFMQHTNKKPNRYKSQSIPGNMLRFLRAFDLSIFKSDEKDLEYRRRISLLLNSLESIVEL